MAFFLYIATQTNFQITRAIQVKPGHMMEFVLNEGIKLIVKH